MQQNVTASSSEDVQKFLTFLIDMYPGFRVDTETGQIIRQSDGTPSVLGRGEAVRPAFVYGPNLPSSDVYIINPLAEGCNDQSQPQIFFYSTMQNTLAILLYEVIAHVIHMGSMAVAQAKAVTAKTKKKAEEVAEEELAIPREISTVLSQKTLQGKAIIDEIDDKSFDEANKWIRSVLDVKSPLPLISIRWIQKSLTSFAYCPLVQEPDTIDMQSGIRKKTLYVIEAIIRGVLGCKTKDDLKAFAVNATEIEVAPPKLYSYLSVEFQLLAKLNPFLIAMDSKDAVDLGEFKYHLKRLPEYTLNAQWMTQPSVSPTAASRTPTIGSALPGTAVPGSGIPGTDAAGVPVGSDSGLPPQPGEIAQPQQMIGQQNLPSPNLPSGPVSNLPSQNGMFTNVPQNPNPMMNGGMIGGNNGMIGGGMGMAQPMVIGQQQQTPNMMGGGMMIGQQQQSGFGMGGNGLMGSSFIPGMPFGMIA